MDTCDKPKENDKPTIASESTAIYGTADPTISPGFHPSPAMDDGYMTLEQFGELFHQKLDGCYANLQGKN